MKIGVYYIRQPVERGKMSLSGAQGSVWQWKTEIPRDSGKRVRQIGCTLFFMAWLKPSPTADTRSRLKMI